MTENQKVLLGVVELNEAKRIRSLLENQGVELEFVSNPHTCSSGKCGAQVEVHANAWDMPAIVAFFKREKARDLGGLEFNPELSDEVFDPTRETARCPACGTEFPTANKECPDCGLVFLTEDQG